MSKTSPTQILLDTAVLSRATSRLLEDLGLPASAKQRALNTLAAEICESPKRNWGYLTNYADGVLMAPGLTQAPARVDDSPKKSMMELSLAFPSPKGPITVKACNLYPAVFQITLPGDPGQRFLSFACVLKEALGLTGTLDDEEPHLLWEKLPEDLQETLRDHALSEYQSFKMVSTLARAAKDAVSELPEGINFEFELGDEKAPVIDLIVAENPRHEAVLERVLDYYLLRHLGNPWTLESRIEYEGIHCVYDVVADHMPEVYLREIQALNAKLLAEIGGASIVDRRHAKADQAFEDHDFGAYTVEDASGWEYVNDGRSMTRPLFFEDPADPEKDSRKGYFTVVFEKNSDTIVEISAGIEGYEL